MSAPMPMPLLLDCDGGNDDALAVLGALTYGRTVIGFPGKSGQPPNCEIAVGLDAARCRAALLAALRARSTQEA